MLTGWCVNYDGPRYGTIEAKVPADFKFSRFLIHYGHSSTGDWSPRTRGYRQHNEPHTDNAFYFTRFNLGGDGYRAVTIRLDLLTPNEIESGKLDICETDGKKIDFSQEFKELRKKRIKDVEFYRINEFTIITDRENLANRYLFIYRTYVPAYQLAEKLVERFKEPALPPPDFRRLKSNLGAKEPSVVIKPSAKDDGIPVHYLIMAAHSSVVETIAKAGMKETQENEIVLIADTSIKTVKKIVDFLYSMGNMTLVAESPKEGYEIFEFGRRYEIAQLKFPSKAAQTHLLLLGHPRSFVHPYALKGQLENMPDEEIDEFLLKAIKRVDEAYRQWIKPILNEDDDLIAPMQISASEESKEDV